MELLITAKYETNTGHSWSGLKRDAAFFFLFFFGNKKNNFKNTT